MQYSLNEITLLPSYIPIDISSRSQVNPFTAALRSTMSYVGAHNLDELRNNTQYDIQSIEEFKFYYK